jgi:hypothetical protein
MVRSSTKPTSEDQTDRVGTGPNGPGREIEAVCGPREVVRQATPAVAGSRSQAQPDKGGFESFGEGFDGCGVGVDVPGEGASAEGPTATGGDVGEGAEGWLRVRCS